MGYKDMGHNLPGSGLEQGVSNHMTGNQGSTKMRTTWGERVSYQEFPNYMIGS